MLKPNSGFALFMSFNTNTADTVVGNEKTPTASSKDEKDTASAGETAKDETTETKIAVDNNKAEFGFGDTDQETSCGDQCAVGPTVHCHHTDESASDERMIMFDEMELS